MNIYDLIAISPIVLLAYAIWQHNNISLQARNLAKRHCEKSGVQLLDDNVWLKHLSPCRSPHSLLAIKRVYRFEFSSVGDFRYPGSITFVGKRMHHIELAPFKTAQADPFSTSIH